MGGLSSRGTCLPSMYQAQGLTHSTKKEEEEVEREEKKRKKKKGQGGNWKRRKRGENNEIVLERQQRCQNNPAIQEMSKSLLGRIGMILGITVARKLVP